MFEVSKSRISSQVPQGIQLLFGRHRYALAAFALAGFTVAMGCGDPEDGKKDEPAAVDAGSQPDGALFGDAGTVHPADGSGADADNAAADAVGDVVAPADSGPGDVAGPSCPGNPGCSCLAAIDCDSGFCIESPNGKICATICVDSCEPGFKCTTVAGAGGDGQNICVAKWGKRCNPCDANADCKAVGHGDAVCVDHGNAGSFCGAACSEDEDCGAGFACKEAADVNGKKSKQCVVTEGVCTCSPAAIAAQASTSCLVVAGEAKCAGKRTCLDKGHPDAPAAGGLSACMAPKPEPEVCDGADNDCDGEADEGTCDDDNVCTSDSCGGAAGCQHSNKEGGCNADDSACTEGDACADGKCVAGKALDCDDANICTADACDADKGCVSTAKSKTTCNADDNPCTVGDACAEGVCKAGPAKQCASADFCVLGKCNLVTGKCKFVYKTDTPCNDGNACTAGEVCVEDICKGKAVNCDDANACTAESCDPAKGCLYAKNPGPCNDGNACTKGDACADGACAGLPIAVSASCDDLNPCTADTCNPQSGCVHAAGTGGPCEDGNLCTTSDLCKEGKCEAGTNQCTCTSDLDCAAKEDGNICNGTLFCDKKEMPWSCKIKPSTVVKCDTSINDACKANGCDPQKGKCVLTLKIDGSPCDADSSLCTVGDACKAGNCVAGPLAKCDDGNPCTTDSCDPKTGCKKVPHTSACDADGDLCTVGDACKSGTCIVGKVTKNCEDNEPCTSESCVKSTGKCAVKKLAKSCDDGSLCTVGDACANDPKTGAWTCLPASVKKCDDANPCTDDSCDAKKGCANVNNKGGCDADGNACTVGDYCVAGVCKVGGLPKNCDDKNQCTVETCVKSTGLCAYQEQSKSCDDANPCTVADKCGSDKAKKWVCLPGAAKQCDDGNICTKDACDPVKGCVSKLDTETGHPCYTGPPKTRNKGICKDGVRTCDINGQLSACKGDVLPGPAEVCNGKDDDCDGVTDSGCKPLGFEAAFGSASFDVKSGARRVRGLAGADAVGGAAGGKKTSARFGFMAWAWSLVGAK